MRMGRAFAAAAIAALGVLAACERSQPTGVRGEVAVVGRAGEALRIAPAEIQFIPEAAMAPLLAARAEEARGRIESLRAAREKLQAEVENLNREKDRTERLWRATMEGDLRRRLELQYHPPASVQEMRSIQKGYMKDKRASHTRALTAARVATEKENQAQALKGEAARFRDGAFFAQGLPPAAQVARTDPEGKFAAALPPGRYAAVARVEAQAGEPRPIFHWIVWTTVEARKETLLRLANDNLHGTDCASCAVAVKGLGE